MNHTPSGAIAVGFNGSLARHLAELKHFEEHNQAWALLQATIEGTSLLIRFAQSLGASPEVITGPNAIEFLDKNHAAFTSFQAGFRLACSIARI